MNTLPIASRRHLLVVLAIIAALALAGTCQSRVLAGSSATNEGHFVLYAVLICMQLLWLRYIHVGMRAAGHRLAELTGGWWRAVPVLCGDLVLATAALFAAQFATRNVRMLLGGEPPGTAFLLPHGVLDRTIWILVSCSAGLAEEVGFRGYLQRQLAGLAGSAFLGVLLQAVLFGVSHGYQGPVSIASTATYGFVLGLLAWWRGNVRAAVVAHVATDILGGLLAGQ